VPLVAAALGSKMTAHASRLADTWNTMSFDPDFDAQLAELSTRANSMDSLCAEAGRDPSTLRRSANLFNAEARGSGGRFRYYDDELFERIVRTLIGAGYTDIGLFYLTDPSQLQAFERIATDIVPRLRTGSI
jgi:alkanesulfonate monooxygenase SsuD/methylene tetrahydromethanopterin reductase-like flavin-dependent oxidoreductase (luciferase family)